jgi:hypothetical protein
MVEPIKRGRGRPRYRAVPKCRITTLLEPPLMDRVDETAAQEGVCRNDLVVRALEAFLATMGKAEPVAATSR